MKIKKINTVAKTAPRLMSVKEAADYLGIGISTAQHFLNEINAKVKIGRRALYDKKIIDKHLDSINAFKKEET